MKRSSDWIIALGVIACSVILLGALAFALAGNPFAKPSRTIKARFADITGIQQSSIVKYAGAVAGTVSAVRILSPEERRESNDPSSAVEVTLAIDEGIPSFSEGTIATVSADTLLADKFIQLEPGPGANPPLANGALIPSITPVPVDELVRSLDQTVGSINKLLSNPQSEFGGMFDQVGDVLTKASTTLDQMQGLLGRADGTLGNADQLIADAGGTVDNADELIADADKLVASASDVVSGDGKNLRTLIVELDSAADRISSMAARAERLIATSEKNLHVTLEDAQVAVQNLKVTSTYAKALARSLAERPHQLIWGPRPKDRNLPPERHILEADEPIPLQ